MDTLHHVLRSLRGESKSRPDHLTVFREFLGHLERIGRRAARNPPARKAKTKSTRKR